VQILLPDLIALPVEIEKWEIFPKYPENGNQKVVVDLIQKGDNVITSDVSVIDTKGRVFERLHGYKTKIIEKVQNAPRPEDLKNPDNWDESQIEINFNVTVRESTG
jgi:hypothetical protein